MFAGDFFGPPKESGDYVDEDEVMQLLNGSLEGMLNVLLHKTFANRLHLRSSHRMLHYARGALIAASGH